MKLCITATGKNIDANIDARLFIMNTQWVH